MDPIFRPLEDDEKVRRFLKKEFLMDNGDGTYDYSGNLYLDNLYLKSINGLSKIRKIHKNFYCYCNQLTSLKGGPSEVGEDYYCFDNRLKSLTGGPESVGHNFDCSNNQIISLADGPKNIGWSYDCSRNQIKSLENGPDNVGMDFICSYNQLTSLRGAPVKIEWFFGCSENKLFSLDGAPEWVMKTFDCSGNPLETLEGMPKFIGWDFILYKCPKANDIKWLKSEFYEHAGIIKGIIIVNQWRFRWFHDRKELRSI